MNHKLHPGDKDFVYSYTQLTTYEECHYAYYLKYIEDNDVEPVGNGFADYGSLCHELIDEWAKGLITAEDLPDEYKARFPQEVCHPFPRMMRNISEKLYDSGLNYFEKFDSFDGYEIIATEKTYYTEIAGKKFKGVIDMLVRDKLTGCLILLDHKSKSLATFKKEEGTIYNQLLLYCKFVYEEYGEWPAMLAFNLFREGGVIKEKPFDMAEYERVLHWAEKIISSIEEGDPFSMIEMKDEPSFYCNNLCDMRKTCAFGTAKIARKKDAQTV